MNIAELPFNKLIGLELAGPEDNLMVGLPEHPQYLNHLGTVHASALLAVAEAGSGEFLKRNFGHVRNVLPVVRKFEAKFRKPGNGRITARCAVPAEVLADWLAELAARGRLSAAIPVEVIDSRGTVVLAATVEWFISGESTRI